MELGAPQMPVEAFGPWATRMRRHQDIDLAVARPRHVQFTIPAQTGPAGASCCYTITREASPSRIQSEGTKSETTNSSTSYSNGNSRATCYGFCPSTTSTVNISAPDSADVKPHTKPRRQLQAEESDLTGPPSEIRNGEHGHRVAIDVEEDEDLEEIEGTPEPELDPETEITLTLPLRPSPGPSLHPSSGSGSKKRIRDSHDVDGPETDKVPIKKRRLLLRLVTSRLSRPFSLPATYLVLRKRSPVLHHRIPFHRPALPFQHPHPSPLQQQHDIHSPGARPGRSGIYQSNSLVRKVAILNRIRIRVLQTSPSRVDISGSYDVGTVTGAEIASLSKDVSVYSKEVGLGLLLSMPVLGPGAGLGASMETRTNLTGSHTSAAQSGKSRIETTAPFQPHHNLGGRPSIGLPEAVYSKARNRHHSEARTNEHNLSSNLRPSTEGPVSLEITPPRPPSHTPESSEEEDNTAFPASSFRDRYADISDDDMDDVYADFGVLFGPGPRSPEGRAVGSSPEEQCYEEYLDELDGIPWVM
ncbi:hypothetical protein F5Y17DRAFT_354763 [Xylariaceae sp. FL0594]|nr:hypothetical protein F5Y17DRAFT_354763 [Xylariaceae sp. FL0594]